MTPGTCEHCRTYQGHAATCPTQLQTKEQRIAHVAWRWNRQYSHTAEFLKLGFTAEEIDTGNGLGMQMADEYYANRCYYGDPAYGRWPDSAKQPIRDKVRAMMQAPIPETVESDLERARR